MHNCKIPKLILRKKAPWVIPLSNISLSLARLCLCQRDRFINCLVNKKMPSLKGLLMRPWLSWASHLSPGTFITKSHNKMAWLWFFWGLLNNFAYKICKFYALYFSIKRFVNVAKKKHFFDHIIKLLRQAKPHKLYW